MVEAMLYFMYNFHYDTGALVELRGTPVIFQVKMYAMGDLYDITSLKEYARGEFSKALYKGWRTDELVPAITEIYASTPESDRGLRDIVAGKCARNMKVLAGQSSFAATLRETTGFAADLSLAMVATVEDLVKGEWWMLPVCQKRKALCRQVPTFYHIHSAVPGRIGGVYCSACGSSTSLVLPSPDQLGEVGGMLRWKG